MKQRLFFACIVVFWAIMNFLLWQAHNGSTGVTGTATSPAVIWQRMLTAPDTSSMEIIRKKQKLGSCRWIASVIEGRAPVSSVFPVDEESELLTSDGMVKKIDGYSIDLEGNLLMQEFKGNLRFDLRINLDTNFAWNLLQLRLSIRPATWEITANAQTETIHLKINDGETASDHYYRFDDLANPTKLFQDFELDAPLAWLVATMMPREINIKKMDSDLGVRFQAFNDTLRFGEISLRAYRVKLRLFNRYDLTAFISRAGEIMRVELPEDVVMNNYAFGFFSTTNP